jgi:glyoxylase-like metal-dependent hydrolase (beta-lactamase superfamily II)
LEIAPGVHSIGQRKGGRVHAFLLVDGTELTLIDTLFDTDARAVLAEIARVGRAPADVKRIALTHAHRSHLGGLATLKRLTRATVCCHEWEGDIVAGEREAQRITLVPKRPLRVYFPFQVGLAFGLGKHRPCPVDEGLREGDELGRFRVLHLPGHTPGHLGFWWEEARVLIAGDAIATWPELAPGWPAFNLNPRRQHESVRRMAALEPNAVGVGHGDPIVTGAAALVSGLVEP